MITDLLREELAHVASSPDVELAVVTLPADEWPDLAEQFPESVLVLAAEPRHVVIVVADEWLDIEAQFPEARLSEAE